MAVPDTAPPSRPAVAASAQDLSDAEFAELDALLADIPEPLDPLDAVMLDGFIAGVIVQPALIDAERWLPYVFDAGGHRWGEAEPSAEQRRARELVLRRHAAMNRSLAEFGSFDPLILEPDEPEAPDAADPADPAEASDAPAEAAATAAPALDATTRALLPWVAGFEFAASVFAGLYELENDAVATTLTRLYRFLPAEGDDEEAIAAVVAAERPLTSLDDGIVEIIGCVAELYDLTSPLRYQVDTVRRATPKVGRNDPCPCGSGRKFKQCHGAGAG